MAFRDLVEVQRDKSEEGQIDPDWYEDSLIPCNINNTSGGEIIRGKQIEAHTKYVIETRFTSSITPSMRLVVQSGIHYGKILNIVAVNAVERRKPLRPHLLLIQCTEKIN